MVEQDERECALVLPLVVLVLPEEGPGITDPWHPGRSRKKVGKEAANKRVKVLSN